MSKHSAGSAYQAAKDRAKARSAAITLAGQDIAPMPSPKDPRRRVRADRDFKFFCEAYFPHLFTLEWSQDHLRVIAKIERVVRYRETLAVAMPRGSGKALALDTPLPTPTGWTTMGDVAVGGMLFDEQGRPCRVTFATEVMHDRPCYRVSFSDGESIVCDADHLWTVHDRYSRRNPLTLRTADMVGRTRIGNRLDRVEHRYAIPLTKPLQGPEDRLPIRPYVLGLWLGNGAASCASITNHASDHRELTWLVSLAGETMQPRAHRQRGLSMTSSLSRRGTWGGFPRPFQTRLRELGLLGAKHIPRSYLRAGPEHRLALLQGLMDTDGSIAENGKCELTLKDGPLARDVAELLASLGIKFGVGRKWVRLDGKLLGPYQRFCFTASLELPVFRLKRKRAKLPERTSSAPHRRFITAIEPVPSVPVRCVQVDSPSQLYLAGRKMVPTHNTTLCLVAVLWAVLSGQHEFVFLIASAQEAALSMLANIKSHLVGNELLLADYPEAIYPIRCLEGEARRCTGQRYYGHLTRIGWGVDELICPTIPGSRCSGSIIRVSGLTGNIRGALHVRADGSQVRPTLVVCDDPQTDQSARSLLQTAERLAIINGAIKGLAGPGQRTAIVIPCTVIQGGDLADQLLDRQKNPSWHGERTKLVYSFPVADKLWGEYSRIRDESLRADGDGHEATEFYAAHREAMDAGAVIAWPARYLQSRGEISAIQHAMNLKLDNERAFFAEYQNEPLRPSELRAEVLTVQQVAEKANGRPPREVPLACTKLTMFVDVHNKLLYYCVCAWQEDFTGFVIDYGTFPEQTERVFALDGARRTLGRAFPGAGPDGAIQAGLEKLVGTYLATDFRRGTGLMRIDRLLVDMGYKPGIVAAVKHRAGGSVMMLYKGLGIRAGHKPMSSYARKPGEQHGHFWFVPNVSRTSEFPPRGRGRQLLEDLYPHRPGHRRRRLRQPDPFRSGPRP